MFSLLDGFLGYNQVLVTNFDQLKTSFRTPWGTFSYRRMPFGLINAGATFKRAMNIAFLCFLQRFVIIYLDDITIFTKKRHDHLLALRHVFDRCKKYGISLNPKKSFFWSLKVNSWSSLFLKMEQSLIPKGWKQLKKPVFPDRRKLCSLS